MEKRGLGNRAIFIVLLILVSLVVLFVPSNSPTGLQSLEGSLPVYTGGVFNVSSAVPLSISLSDYFKSPLNRSLSFIVQGEGVALEGDRLTFASNVSGEHYVTIMVSDGENTLYKQLTFSVGASGTVLPSSRRTESRGAQLVIPVNGNLSCRYRMNSCAFNETKILAIVNETNAHAELPNETNYPLFLCCNDTSGNNTISTSSSGTSFLHLGAFTNAHVELFNETNMSINAYISASGNDINCSVQPTGEGACPVGQTCMGTLAANTAAHIGNCSAYNVTVCCGLGGRTTIYVPPIAPPASNFTANGSVNGTLNSTEVSYVTQTVTFLNQSTGRKFARFVGQFNLSSVNMTNLTVQFNDTALAVNASGVTGVLSNHTLFLNSTIILNSGLRFCPSATALSHIGASCSGKIEFRGPFPRTQNGITVSDVGGEYVIDNVTGSGAALLTDPYIEQVVLNSTDGSGAAGNNATNSETLTAVLINVSDVGGIKNITNWYLNGTSIMVLNLPFEGGSNSTFTRDYSPHGNNGSPTSNVFNMTAGYDGHGVLMHAGLGNGFNVSNSSSLSLTDNFTIGVWYYKQGSGSERFIISKDNGWRIRYPYANNTVEFRRDDNSDFVDFDVGDNVWTHLVAVKNSTHIALYINGTLVESKASSGPLSNVGGNFVIGSQGGTANAFGGRIDDILILNRSLSAEQVASLHNTSLQIVSQELRVNDRWSVSVTPNNRVVDGETRFSNNVTIVPANTAPVIARVILNSTDGSGETGNNATTDENLTAVIINATDADGDPVQNLIDWRLNNRSIAVLNAQFENGSSNSTFMKDYSSFNKSTTFLTNVTFNSTGGFDGRGAYLFNHSSSQIAVPGAEFNFSEANNFTLMARINSVNVSQGFQGILDKLGTNNGYRLILSSGSVSFQVRNSTNSIISASSSALQSNTWYHVAGVFNGSALRLYINGSLVATTAFTINNIGTSGLTFRIGFASNSLTSFNGSIDDVLVFNRSLSADQILAIYNGQTNVLVHNETVRSENWSVAVTPNDGKVDGSTVLSNNVTIVNVQSSIAQVILNSTDGSGATGNNASSDEDLTVFVINATDADSDAVQNITDWRLNGTSIAVLNMPFETNTSSLAIGAIKDYSTAVSNGTLGGGVADQAPIWNNSGKVGGTYIFDGFNDYVNLSGSGALNITGSKLTIAAWFYVREYAGICDGGITRASEVSPFGGYLLSPCTTGTPGDFVFAVANSSGSWLNIAGAVNKSINTWYHVAGVYDADAGNMKLYVDGIEEASQNVTGNIRDSNFPVRIGLNGANFFNGSIDEIFILNDSLSSQQIIQLMQDNIGSKHLTNIVSPETEVGNIWSVAVTPNDYVVDGETKFSNNVTILISNTTPSIAQVILNSTDGSGESENNASTDENLTVFIINSTDADNDHVQNITDWRLNGVSIAVLNLPFESAVSSTSAGAIRSYSSFSNNATLGNGSAGTAPVWNSSGKVGGSYTFDGLNDQIRTPINTTLQRFTYEAWILPRFKATGTLNTIVSKSSYFALAQSDFPTGFYANAEASGLQCDVNSGSDYINDLSSIGSVTPNAWNHVVCTYNGTHLAVYVNGILSDSDAGVVTLSSNSQPYTVGHSAQEAGAGIGASAFNGSIDEFRIYNRSLSAAQIYQLFIDGNRSRHMESLHFNETLGGNVWSVAVTPNDNSQNADGLTVLSNNVTILNSVPSIAQAVLNSTDGSGAAGNNATTDENLTAVFINVSDPDNTAVQNITDWRVNNRSIAVLNMPFETNTSSTSSGAVRDYSQFTNNGTLGTGGAGTVPTWNASGKVGGAYTFNASGTVILLDPGTGYLENYTFATWVKRNNFGSIWHLLAAGNSTTQYIAFHNGLANRVILSYRNTSDVQRTCYSDTAIADTNWHHIVVSVESKGLIRMYIDGNQDTTTTCNHPQNNGNASTSVSSFNRLGEYSVAGFGLNGTLDEVQVFNRTLTAGQIYQLYLNGNSSKHMETLHFNETTIDQNWSVAVTPNDGFVDGATVLSNNVTIVNSAPSIAQVSLNSTDGSGATSNTASIGENLTVVSLNTSDIDSNPVRNITDWRLNGSSLAVLNMPFETNSSSTSTGAVRSYAQFNFSGTLGGGTAANVPVWNASGKAGGAYTFDGVNDFIATNYTTSVGTSPYTFAAWINAPDLNQLSAIVAKRPASNNQLAIYMCGNSACSASGQLFVAFERDTANRAVISTTDIADGQWHHLVMTRDSSAIRAYVDGVLEAQSTAAIRNVVSTQRITIGNADNTYAGDEFNGSIDEVLVLNRSLSADEVYQLFISGNQSRHFEMVLGNATSLGQVWSVAVTPNDGIDDGSTVLSNNVTITTAPLQVVLNSPADNVHTRDMQGGFNLNCSFSSDDLITNISVYDTFNGSFILRNAATVSGNGSYVFNTSVASALNNQTILDRTVDWNCQACTLTNCSFASANFSFSGWDNGTYVNLTHNTSARRITLVPNASGEFENLTGIYTSRIFNFSAKSRLLRLFFDSNQPVNITNPSFENGTVGACPTGWTCQGDAEMASSTDGQGCTIAVGIAGTKYAKVGCDATFANLTSSQFYLPPGVDKLRFLRSGGSDSPSGLYIKRVSDNATLCSGTGGANTNTFFVDNCTGLSSFAGEGVYIFVTDAQTGSFGHVYIDNLTFVNAAGASLDSASFGNISFFTRSCSTSNCADINFSGGYNESNSGIDVNSGRYFQYRANFSAFNSTVGPVLFTESVRMTSESVGVFQKPSNPFTASFDVNGTVNATILNSTFYEQDQYITLNHSTFGRRVLFYARFNSSDVDLRNLTINATTNATAITIGGGLKGIDFGFTMFVPNLGQGVTVCPNATIVANTNVSCPNAVGFTHNDALAGNSREGYTISIDGSDYRVDGIFSTGLAQGVNFNLTIYDDTNDGPLGANASRYLTEIVGFYANFSKGFVSANTTDGACKIQFNVSGNVGPVIDMSYITSTRLFVRNETFSEFGNFTFAVNCTDAGETLNATDDFEIKSPVLFLNRSYEFNVSRKEGAFVRLAIRNFAGFVAQNLTGNTTSIGAVLPIGFIGALHDDATLDLNSNTSFNATIGLTLARSTANNYTFNATLRGIQFNVTLDTVPVTIYLPSINETNYNFSVSPTSHTFTITNQSSAGQVCSDSKVTLSITNTGQENITNFNMSRAGTLKVRVVPDGITDFVIRRNETINVTVYALINETTPTSSVTFNFTGGSVLRQVTLSYTNSGLSSWASPPSIVDQTVVFGPTLTARCANGAGYDNYITIPENYNLSKITGALFVTNFVERLCPDGVATQANMSLNGNAVLSVTRPFGVYSASVSPGILTNSNLVALTSGPGSGHYCAAGASSIHATFSETAGEYCAACSPNGTREVVFTDGIDNDCDSLIDCDDDDSCGASECSGAGGLHQLFCPPQEVCNNGVDDNVNGLTDCDDVNVCCTASSCGSSIACANIADNICDYGNFNTLCVINTNRSLAAVFTPLAMRSFEVRGPNVRVNVTQFGVNATADVTLGSGVIIDGRGRGYGANSGPGAPSSHGGGAERYDSPFSPNDMGSGSSNSAGGGLFRVIAGGIFTSNAAIDMNGTTTASIGSSGAAGGGIFINASRVYGAGRYYAIGGSPQAGGTAGGGGRIAIWADNAETINRQLINATAPGDPSRAGTSVLVDKDTQTLITLEKFNFEPIDGTHFRYNVSAVNSTIGINVSTIVNGTYFVMNKSTLAHFSNVFNLTVYGGEMNISGDSLIDGDNGGYYTGQGPAGGGGGHGGQGSGGLSGIYDSALYPSDFGSAVGVRGSGVFRFIGNSFSHYGNITMNSNQNPGIGNSAGGGGSIFINASNVSGSGLFEARGGGPGAGGTGGGGGRIAVWANDVSGFVYRQFNVSGGVGTNLGGDGTAILVDSDSGQYFVVNNFRFEPVDFPTGVVSVPRLVVVNSTLRSHLNGTTLINASSVDFRNGAFVTDASSRFNITILMSEMNFTGNSSFIGNGKGYQNGQGPGVGANGGVGPTHGGQGTGNAQLFVGSALVPDNFGSGGTVGFGGALFRIFGNSLVLNGSINLNATGTGVSSNSGGAGGALFVNVSNFSGNVFVDARGAGGGASGGSGSGGRIAIWADNLSFVNLSRLRADGALVSTEANGTAVVVDRDDRIYYLGHAFRFQSNDLPGGVLSAGEVIGNGTLLRLTVNSTINSSGNVTFIDSHIFGNTNDRLRVEGHSIVLNGSFMNVPRFDFVYNNSIVDSVTTRYRSPQSNLRLERSGLGSINWTASLNNVHNLSRHILISNNSIFVNSTAVSGLNATANVSIRNLSFASPLVFYDPEDDGSFVSCPSSVCTRQTYQGSVLVFNVSRFTTYAAGEGLVLSKSESEDPAFIGSQLTYQIFVNSTAVNASNVTVREFYPAQVSFVSASPLPDSGTNNTWSLGNLTVGSSATVNITVLIVSGIANNTVINNTVNVSSVLNGTNLTLSVTENTTVVLDGRPNISQVILNSTDGSGAVGNNASDGENLTVVIINATDPDNNSVRNITDWRLNGTSIAVLNLPFETNTSSTAWGVVRDYATFVNNGTLGNGSAGASPVWTSGRVGGAYTFDGTNDFIVVNDSASLNITGNMTINAWLLPNISHIGVVLTKRTAGTVNYQFAVVNNGSLQFCAPTCDYSDNVVVPGVYQQYTVTFDGANKYFYRNGTLVTTVPRSESLVLVAEPIIMGQAVGGAFYNGSMDEVSIFNRSLSPAQVYQLYLDGNNSRHMENLHFNETSVSDVWSVAVTPNDNAPNTDGTTVFSNNVMILASNNAPSIAQVILNSTDGSGATGNNASTDENLTVVIINATDADNDAVQNITDWRLNGTSIAVLNMPFETNTSSTSTGAIRDYSTFINNGTLGGGTLSNVPAWVNGGQAGGGYDFDGVDDFITIPHASNQNVGTVFSMEAWIRREGACTNNCIIVMKQNAASGGVAELRYALVVLSGGTLVFSFNNGTWADVVSSTATLSNNVWYHVVGTYDGANARLYVNGTLNNTAAKTGSVLSSTGGTIEIGRETAAATELFNGTIDEVKIYNRTLTAAQVQQSFLDGNRSRHMETLHFNETVLGDNWSVAVTSNDRSEDGATRFSNNVTIVNAAPSIAQVILNSTDGSGASNNNATSDENLTVVIINSTDADSEPVQNITDWRLNGRSIALLNMPFETNSSSTGAGAIRDYSQFGNNGTLGAGSASAVPLWNATGVVGAAYTFDGAADYIKSGVISIPSAGPVGASVWVRPSAFTCPAGAQPSPICTILDIAGSSAANGWIMNVNSAGIANCAYGNGVSTTNAVSTTALAAGGWTHLTCIINGSHVLLYVNGTLEGTGGPATPTISSSTQVDIGAHDESGIGRWFNGSIDEVLIFNRTLSAAQVYRLYLDGNRSKHMESLHFNETTVGQNWSVAVTPNDRTEDGTIRFSNNVTIVNAVPSIAQVILNSTDGSGAVGNNASDGENLTVVIINATDPDNNSVRNITDWRLNGASIAVLNMPFETNTSSTSAGAIRDYSQFGNNGTLGNGSSASAPVWLSGQVGGAFRFDGINDYVEVQPASVLNNQNVSVEAWVRLNSTNGFQVVATKEHGTSWASWYFVVNNGRIRGSVQNSTSGQWPVWESTISLTNNTWTHIAFTFDKNFINASDGRIYINGSPVSTTFTANGYSSAFGIRYDSEPIEIGRSSWSAVNSSFFNGTMDELRVYNRSLFAAQIQQLFQDGNRSRHMESLHFNETRVGQNWSVAVTPNDRTDDGTIRFSNNVTIINAVPSIAQVILNSTDGSGASGNNASDSENLTVVIINATDIDGETVRNITDWRLNGTSVAVLNLPFETNSSSNAVGVIRDYSSFGNNGTLGNGTASAVPVWNVSGKVGGAYTFDGVNDYIDCGVSGIPSSAPLTLEAWAFFNQNQGASEYDYVIQASGFDGNDLFAIAREAGTNNVYYVENGAIRTGPALATGSWQHLVMVFRSSAPFVRFYVNGTSQSITQPSAVLTPGGVLCGLGRFSGNDHFLNGSLDEVKVYDHELSAEQIYQNYLDGNRSRHIETVHFNETNTGNVWSVAVTPNDNAPNTDGATVFSNNVTILAANIAPSIAQVILNSTDGSGETGNNASSDENLTVVIINSTDSDSDPVQNITDWRLNGTSISRLNMPFETNTSSTAAGAVDDYSQSGLDGTLGAGTSSDAPVWNASGKVGGAYTFVSNDYIDLGDVTAFDGVSALSWGAWVYPRSYGPGTDGGSVASIIAKGIYGGGGTNTFYMFMQGDGSGGNNFQCGVDSGSLASAGGNALNLSLNQWNFVACTASVGSPVRWYVNGTLVSSGSTLGGALINIATSLRIGGSGSVLEDGWNGSIDEVFVMPRQLSAAQIYQLYLDGNRSRHMETLHFNETVLGDNWSVAVTPNDRSEDGATRFSNNVTIVNAAPSIAQVILNSTDGSGASNNNASTDENLTVVIINATDADSEPVQNITDWRLNGTSIAVLNLPFETNTSSTAAGAVNDYSIYDNNARLGNGSASAVPMWNSSGRVGGYYSFDGSNDVIVVNNSASTNINNRSISYGGWFRTSGTASFSSILNKVSASSPFPGYNLAVHSDNTLRCDFLVSFPSEWTVVLSTSSVEDGQWHFAVCVWNSTHVKVYVDGRLNNSASYISGIAPSNEDLVIGNDPGTAGRFFTGDIDEVFVMDRALSDAQINRMFLDGNNSRHMETLHFNETTVGQNWSVAVTPNDRAVDGTTRFSNNVTIVSAAPSIAQVLLNSTDGSGASNNNAATDENLTVVIINATDVDNDAVQNITDWRLNGTSIAVLNMPFETNSSSTASGAIRDYSQLGNNLTAGQGSSASVPLWNSSGKIGGAFSFDGLNDYLSKDLPSEFRSLQNFTVSAWVNVRSTAVQQDIIGALPRGTNAIGLGFIFTVPSSGKPIFSKGLSGSFSSVVASSYISNNTWYHIVGSNGPTGMRLYVNGILDNSTADTSAVVWTDAGAGNFPDPAQLIVGARRNNAADANGTVANQFFFNGSIDELVVFNRTLSPAQVYQLYLDGNISKHMENLHFNETTVGQNWSVAVTPNDRSEDGTVRFSNNVTIVNAAPSIAQVILNSTDGSGYLGNNATTDENLTVVIINSTDADSDAVQNITDWRLNGTSIAVLNLPFETNTSSTSTGAIRDYSQFGNNGTLGNGNLLAVPLWNSSGRAGGAFTFDGINDTIQVANSSSLEFGTGDFSVCAWMRTSSLNGGIVTKRNDTTDPYLGWYLRIVSGRSEFDIYDSSDPYPSNTFGVFDYSNVSDNAWHFICGVADRDANASIYIDGVVRNSSSIVGSAGSVNSNSSLVIGNQVENGFPFNGSIDEVLVLNRTLSAAQIYRLYLDGNSSKHMESLHFNETSVGQNWSVAVTPNDNAPNTDGSTVLSNNVTIVSEVVCPLSVSNDTVLTQNLSCPETAINILANNVVLDCNGFTVNYSTSSAGVGINATSRSNVTIKNCLVGKAGSAGSDADAILLSSTSNSKVINNTAVAFGTFSDGIRLDGGSSNNLTGNVGIGPENYGIVLFGSHSNILVNNTGSSANNIGLIISSSSQGTIVRDTVASGSFAFYLDGASNHNVTNLTAVSSANAALSFASSSAGNIVENSILTGPSTVNFASGQNNRLVNSTLQATSSWIASDGSSSGNNFTNTIFNSSNGSIRFPVLFTLPISTAVNVAKLNTSSNNSFLNSTNLSFLNTSAQITLRNLAFTNPRAKVDFEDDNIFANCNSTQCQEISYSGGVFVFNVSSFTSYAAAETNIELLMEKSIITCTAQLNSGASSAVLNTCNDNGGTGSPNPNSGGSISCDGGTAKDSDSNISVCDGGFLVFNDGLEGKFNTNLTNSSGPVDTLYSYLYNYTGCKSSCNLAPPASPLTLSPTVQTACNNFTSGRMCQCLTLQITSPSNVLNAKIGTPVTFTVQDSITTPAVSC